MRVSVPFLLLPPLLFPFVTGCGAGAAAPSKPAVVFPTRAELAVLPSRQPRPEAFGASDVAADTWAVEEPPAGATSYDDRSPVGELARDAQRPHGAHVVLSAPLRCAAHELARFYLAHRGFPNDSLRRFIVGRCGGDAPAVTPVAWLVDGPSAAKDGEIIAHARANLGPLLEKELAAGDHDLGLALARDGGRAVIMGVVARRDAVLEPGARSVDPSRRITLRGVSHRDLAAVTGLTNQGEFGVARCEENPRVPPPKFEVTCELAKGDKWAWVELLGRQKGKMLQEPLADVLVYEGDGAGVAYTARSYGPPAPVRSPGDLTTAMLDRLNAVRVRAKLAPLALAAKQSLENPRLAGTLFDASLQGDAGTADRAAIGLLAGWDVEGGTIRDGYFFLGAAAPTRDATVWLDAALERPIGRIALLDPGVRQIAIGPVVPGDAPALGAAVTTYALFESEDHSAEEAQFLWRVTGAREARGLPAPVRVGGLEEMHTESSEVLLRGKAPMAALQDLLQVVVERTGSSVRGYVIETTDPAHVEVPAELLSDGPLHVVVGVTHHRAPDAAWGQYVIFVLVVDGAKTTPRTAANGDPVAVTAE